MYIQTEALVLREAQYKETDKILTVLTLQTGKRTVRAKGARRFGGKLAAASQPLVYSRMTLFENRDRCTLDEAEVLDTFYGLRRDIERLSLAVYLAGLCEALSDEVPDPAVFSLMLNTCYALARTEKSPALVKPATEMRLLSLCGYQPEVETCPVCGRTPPEAPCLHPQQGVVHCETCRDGLESGRSLPLGEAARLALRHIVLGEAKRLFSFTLAPEPLALLTAAAETYVLAHLERDFPTLDFYHQTVNPPCP
ncbi:MAG: DNA repair protein RecO [Oscillospiraceae bacterium]|jgi:DNA repair protein RecO (recombination protein O)|nr:DNA repair protein RecO [Oscillospiraceae bacterium]